MYCKSCGSKYCKGANTWSGECTLKSSGYSPYTQENYYACNGSSWTVPGNVTMDNSGWKNKVTKEGFNENSNHNKGFCCDSRSTYSKATQAWSKQKPYTTN